MINHIYFYHEACFSFWSNNCRMALAVDLDKNFMDDDIKSCREITSISLSPLLSKLRSGKPPESFNFFFISEFFSKLSCFCRDTKSALPSLQFLLVPVCSISIPISKFSVLRTLNLYQKNQKKFSLYLKYQF